MKIIAYVKGCRGIGHYILVDEEFHLPLPEDLSSLIGDARTCCKVLHHLIKANRCCLDMRVTIYTHQQWTSNILMGAWKPSKKTPHSVETVEVFNQLRKKFDQVTVEWMPYGSLIGHFSTRYERVAPRQFVINVTG